MKRASASLFPSWRSQAGIPYMNGKSTVTFFSAVLYGENGLVLQEE